MIDKTKNPAAVKLPLNSIVDGDCIEVMDGLPECSVDLIFADPPYFKAATDINWSHYLLEHDLLVKLIEPNSYFILEEQNNTPQLAKLKYWKLIRTDTYGLSSVHIYQRLKV